MFLVGRDAEAVGQGGHSLQGAREGKRRSLGRLRRRHQLRQADVALQGFSQRCRAQTVQRRMDASRSLVYQGQYRTVAIFNLIELNSVFRFFNDRS